MDALGLPGDPSPGLLASEDDEEPWEEDESDPVLITDDPVGSLVGYDAPDELYSIGPDPLTSEDDEEPWEEDESNLVLTADDYVDALADYEAPDEPCSVSPDLLISEDEEEPWEEDESDLVLTADDYVDVFAGYAPDLLPVLYPDLFAAGESAPLKEDSLVPAVAYHIGTFAGYNPGLLSGFDPSLFAGYGRDLSDGHEFGDFTAHDRGPSSLLGLFLDTDGEPDQFGGYDPVVFSGYDPSLFAEQDPSGAGRTGSS